MGTLAVIVVSVTHILSLLLIYEVLGNNLMVLKVSKGLLLLGTVMLGLTLLLLARKLGELSRSQASSALPVAAALSAIIMWATGNTLEVYWVLKEGDAPNILAQLVLTFKGIAELSLMAFLLAAALFIMKSGSTSRYAKPVLFPAVAMVGLDFVATLLLLIYIFTEDGWRYLVRETAAYTGLGKNAAILNGLALILMGVTIAMLAPLFRDFVRENAGAAPAWKYPGQPILAGYQYHLPPGPTPYYPPPPLGVAGYPGAFPPGQPFQAPQPAFGFGVQPYAAYPSPIPQAAAINCPDCGTLNPAGAMFCKGCGREFDKGMGEEDTRECPFCAEVIKTKAIKCKHCGSMLDADS